MTGKSKEYGVVVLLEGLGTRKRIQKDIDRFLADWDNVLKRLEANVKILESELGQNGYRTGIRVNDIFDNVQIFYPVDNPHTSYVDLTGSNSIWWSIQHTGDLLVNLIRYAVTKGIYFRGCISMGYIKEYRNGFFSEVMIENAKSLQMIGCIAGPTSVRVLNNKTYFSSARFYNFIKYTVREEELAVLNISRSSKMFANIGNGDINKAIEMKWTKIGMMKEPIRNGKIRETLLNIH